MVPPLFILASSVCKSLQCIISTLTQGSKVVTYLGSLVQLCCGEGGTLQTNTGSAYGGWTTLGLPQPKVACTSRVHTSQAPGCSARALSQVGPAFHALPRSKLPRFLVSSRKHRPWWAVRFVPFQGPSSLCETWCLVSALSQGSCVSYSPPRSWLLGFSGVQ